MVLGGWHSKPAPPLAGCVSWGKGFGLSVFIRKIGMRLEPPCWLLSELSGLLYIKSLEQCLIRNRHLMFVTHSLEIKILGLLL